LSLQPRVWNAIVLASVMAGKDTIIPVYRVVFKVG